MSKKSKLNKKVCMVVLNDFTHDSRVLREAKALQQAGYSVFVLALFERGLKQKQTINGVRVIRIPLITRRILEKTNIRFIRFIEFMIKCLWQIKKIRPFVCHCHDLNTLPIGYTAKKFFHAILIYDSHELESQRAGFDKEARWLYSIKRRLEHFLITKTNKVITVCECIAEHLQKQDGIEIPLVVRNIPDSSPTNNTALKKNYFGFNKNYKIVIYMGGLQILRGLFNLVRAMRFLDKNIILIFVGDGPILKNLQQEAVKLGLSNRIIFKGWQPLNVVVSMAEQSHVGIVPYKNVSMSYYYSLPNKFFEYIAAGIPVAVSNFPEMAKIVNEYKIGKTFNPDSPQDIARAIQSTLKNEVHYQTLKKNVDKARKIFTWNKEKQKLIRLYKNF